MCRHWTGTSHSVTLTKLNSFCTTKANTTQKLTTITISRHNHTRTTAHCQAIDINGRGARWLSGRASDSGARGRGFETYLRRVLSLRKIIYSPNVLVIPWKRWIRIDMTEKLLTGTLSLNTNKQTKTNIKGSQRQI